MIQEKFAMRYSTRLATKPISIVLVLTFCLTQISYASPIMQNLRENQPAQAAGTHEALAGALGVPNDRELSPRDSKIILSITVFIITPKYPNLIVRI